MKKQLLPLAALITVLLPGVSVIAATGNCQADGRFTADVTNSWTKDDNVAGQSKNYAGPINGDSYLVTCACKAGEKVNLYYTVTSALLTVGRTSGFYRLNDKLDIKTVINDIPGVAPTQVPSNAYTPIRDSSGLYQAGKNTSVCEGDPANVRAQNFTMGQNTDITLKVTTPFLGELEIPETHIASIQAAYTTTTSAPRPAQDIVKIYIKGRITVPQHCVVNQGDTINVNLGIISAQHFTTRNQMPSGYTPVNFDVVYDCGDMSKINNNLYMVIEGTDVVDQYNLVARRRESDNAPDVGIRLVDVTNGHVDVPFNPGTILINKSGAGISHFQAYPVNLIGGTVATGPYKASATISIIVR